MTQLFVFFTVFTQQSKEMKPMLTLDILVMICWSSSITSRFWSGFTSSNLALGDKRVIQILLIFMKISKTKDILLLSSLRLKVI